MQSENHKCCMECSFKNKSKGCINRGICSLNLPHSMENHNCGGNHKCQEKCNLFDKAENCVVECVLPYGHLCEHRCSNIHKCKEICYLYRKSKGCKGKCVFEYGHSGNCICGAEKHFCTQKCKQCDNSCTLIVNHKGDCICGGCICGQNCIYKNKSRNCKNKCEKLFGHEGPHICEVESHLCKEECVFWKMTRKINGGCLKYCSFPVDHDNTTMHFCGVDKNKHICSGACELYNKSLKHSCCQFCNKPIEHKGLCLCQNSKEAHICNKECSFININSCKKLCSLSTNLKGNCLCSLVEEGHIYKGEYKIIKKLGEGSYSRVFQVEKENKYFAIKEIEIKGEIKDKIKNIQEEAEILSKFDCKNIVKYYDSFQIKNKFYILMEYCDGIDLRYFINKYINKSELIEENILYNIIKQLCIGIKEIHEKNIIHRDLKPENIFINKKIEIKIGDFGISKQFNSNKKSAITTKKEGTLDYIAPEIKTKGIYNKKSDMYSLGCIIYELFNLRNYFNDKFNEEIKEIDSDIYNYKWQEIINSLLQIDYNKRMNMDQLNEYIHKNSIIGEIYINEDDINKDIRIINSFENIKHEMNWKNKGDKLKYEKKQIIRRKYII